jgi:RNA polymerase-interacting CarD/CdnL/TRCF family regulator
MTKQITLNLDSLFITKGKVYRVFHIEDSPKEGDERTIHYRPYYMDSTNTTLVCSIPESSIRQIDARNPVSKAEMLKLMNSLSNVGAEVDDISAAEAKSILEQNNIHEIAMVLKVYWRARRENGGKYTRAREEIINTSIAKMLEEVALLNDISLDEARNRIKIALGE